MGLITGLLTLPLAPVRGVAWIGEQLALEAERQLDDAPRRELAELQAAFDRGEIDEPEFERREEELLAALEAS